MPSCQYSGAVLHNNSSMDNNKYNCKNQELVQLDQKVKNILLYKKKIHRNSTCSKIMEMMYPDIRLTIRQITSKINCKSYVYTKKIILQMHSHGYLIHDDGKEYNRSYSLSQTGRWFAVCVTLDYIPFQSLCILSQTYYKVKKDPNSRMCCYMISKFRDIFDKSYDGEDRACASAIYSNSNIFRSVRHLADRNLVYWANSEFLKISLPVIEYLQEKYDNELSSLVKWCDETFERCKDERYSSLQISDNKRKIFSLFCNA